MDDVQLGYYELPQGNLVKRLSFVNCYLRHEKALILAKIRAARRFLLEEYFRIDQALRTQAKQKKFLAYFVYTELEDDEKFTDEVFRIHGNNPNEAYKHIKFYQICLSNYFIEEFWNEICTD